MRPFACERCFEDEALSKWIRVNGKLGRCSWCGARNSYLVPIAELAELFRNVARIYTPSEDAHGELIGELIQQSWQVFSERIEDRSLVQDMTVEILEADLTAGEISEGEDYSALFQTFDAFHSTLEESWHERVETFFLGPSKTPPEANDEEVRLLEEAHEEIVWRLEERLGFAISDLGLDYPVGRVLYRARVHKERNRTTRFATSEMGAPPACKVKAARANREGQPVLYMASNKMTALAEVRAWKGAVVAVAKTKIVKPLQILDLRETLSLASPFFEENLQWRIEGNELLNRFGDELSRPVMPHEEETHYLPSQYLCEIVRGGGYAGIAYPSAMGEGYNVVLFDPEAAVATSVVYHRVKKLGALSKVIQEEQIQIDDWPW